MLSPVRSQGESPTHHRVASHRFREPLLAHLRSAAIRTVRRTDDDLLASRNERRNAGPQPSLACRFFELICGSRALDPRSGVRDLQRDRQRQLDRDRLTVAPQHDDRIVRQDVECQVSRNIFREFNLFEGLGIHKDRGRTLVIKVLHRSAIKVDLLNTFIGAQTLLNERAIFQISELDLHKRSEVSRRAVLGFGNQVQLAIHLDGHSV